MGETISFQIDDDGVATLVLDIKDRPMNLLTPELLDELESCVAKVASDGALKGAIITSGKDVFLAGADLKDLVNLYDRRQTAAETYAQVRRCTELLRRMETSGKPFVAAINGTALGGGLEICLACHHRIAANNPKAVLGLPEVSIGLLPGAGGTQRLPRLIGIAKALELTTKGSHVSPQEAAELGFVDEVVEPAQLLARAKAWLMETGEAEQPWDKKGFKVPGGAGISNPVVAQTLTVGTSLIARQSKHNYPAPIAIASCIYEGTVVPIEAGLRIESRYFVSLLMDPVYRNLTRTLFINKGAADKLVARPAGVEKSSVRKLGVLGAGMMGAGIAYLTARAGMEVVLLDTSIDLAERGKDYSRKLLQKRLDKGRMVKGDADALLERINTTTDFADLAGADLVIEAVFENREIKAAVTAKTEAVIPPGTVFASNTSTLPITGLAESSSSPENFIGLHFFSPVDRMPLVEVILGEKTADQTLARSLDYISKIRKTPIVVTDSWGFFTSRVFSRFTNEGMELLKDGVKPALIENAAKQAGMPVGPLAVTDEVTLDLLIKVHEQTLADIGDDYKPPSAIDVADRFVKQLDRKGKRFGAGFYEYPEDKKKHLWPGLNEIYPLAAKQPTVDEVEKRLLYVQALDTVRCLDEGVIRHPADADIGSILGIGFPAWTGGAISLIETVGLKEFVADCDRMAGEYGARFEIPDSLRRLAESGGRFYPINGADKRSAA